MKIFILGNNAIAARLTRWLVDSGEEVVGLALHPSQRRQAGEELIRASGLPPGRIFDGASLGDPNQLSAIQELGADIAVSLFFGYILRSEFLDLFARGVINLHPAYLPYNRGAFPNVWSIIDRTPAGVTLHHVDAGVDTGDIIAREEVTVAATDTGETLYLKLEREAENLFRRSWPSLADGSAPRLPQTGQGATVHRMRDVQTVDEIDPERSYTGRELIDILRARTFPPYSGAFIRHDGRKIYLRLSLLEEDEL